MLAGAGKTKRAGEGGACICPNRPPVRSDANHSLRSSSRSVLIGRLNYVVPIATVGRRKAWRVNMLRSSAGGSL